MTRTRDKRCFRLFTATSMIRGRKTEIAECPYVFVKCFTPRVDYLPMWEMWRPCVGCCLMGDWETTKNLSCAVEPDTLSCLLSPEERQKYGFCGDNEKLAQNYREIERQLRQLRQITKRTEQSKTVPILTPSLAKSSTSSKTAATATSRSCGSSTRRRTTSSTLTATSRGFRSDALPAPAG